ncbi:MAG: FtsX-like permease family protein, partial [Clostridia bacterium]|nr:FtsX-like permease family protein [Clostridia bacterium]
VSFRKKEIGLLRSLGARPLDIHRIFAAKALVISLLCALPAGLASALSTVWINRVAHEAGVRLSVLYFSPLALLALVAVAVLSALVSSFLPILLMNRNTPAALLSTS